MSAGTGGRSGSVADRTGQAVASALIDAPAEVVHELLTDLALWPRLFPWILHTECLERDGNTDLVRYWGVTAEETIRTWVSRRRVDPAGLRMDFEQQGAVGEVARLSGSWVCTAQADGRTLIESVHEFALAEGAPVGREQVTEMFHGRSRVQLARLAECAERRAEWDGRTLSFTDSLTLPAAPDEVYRALADPARWPQGHGTGEGVVRAEVTEKEPGVQFLDLDVRAPDGSLRTARTVRLPLSPDRIVLKYLGRPTGIELHTGRWTVAPAGEGTLVTADQTVVLNSAASKGELPVRLRLRLGEDALVILRAIRGRPRP
ncbi:SRPBCC family protein [Streptomyces sp. NPDC057545]|uniref:aromatase/cyclase n=1 Tax=Streptomyces sp. NPDC057545 TaxID=3346164 RepID=UPI0036C35FC6